MTKENFFALAPSGDIVHLGMYEDFGEAADAHTDMVWIVDEPSARDWLLSLLALNQNFGLGVKP
jgi:hypothetical protein